MRLLLLCVTLSGVLLTLTSSPGAATSEYGSLSKEEYYESKGQGFAQQAANKDLARKIKKRFRPSGKSLPGDTDEMLGDIVLTNEQLKWVEKHTKHLEKRDLEKRKILDFGAIPTRKWDPIIFYTFQENAFTDYEKDQIHMATGIWNEETCIHFEELSLQTTPTGPYIEFQREDAGCWSYLGSVMTYGGKQPINLGSGCFSAKTTDKLRVGTIVHEIGHAIGLMHEQQRLDRDNYINIHYENIISGKETQFQFQSDQDAEILNLIPYDVSSVMQYPPWGFQIAWGLNTMTTKDPLFQFGMGQRYRPSFFDSKAVNLVYCADSCPAEMSSPCDRWGYQDPNNCGYCRCMEGWSGTYCSYVDPGTSGHGSDCPRAGLIETEGTQDECMDVKLPHYDDTRKDCNWYIKLHNRPVSDTLDFWLMSIDIYEKSGTCYDYVEVKHNRFLDTRGPRFCSIWPLDEVDGNEGHFVTSEANHISVNLVSYVRDYRPSFKMCYRMTPRCSMRGYGNGVVTPTHHRSSTPDAIIDMKETLAQSGSDTNPCKVKVVVRTNGDGDVIWAAVSMGKHANPTRFPTKYYKNIAFNLQGDEGVWERGAKIADPVEITSASFPYTWSNNKIFSSVVELEPYQHWRIEVFCKSKKLLFMDFGKDGMKNIDISFGVRSDWSGECF